MINGSDKQFDVTGKDRGDSRHISYRPEIDGLRGIAVLSVVLFHAGLSVTGGFVGVDVFFVISGYLLTSIIVNDIRQDRFTFLKFWERRARRILPPAIAMNVVVIIAGWLLLLPGDFLEVGRSTIAQTIFLANFYFWQSTGYFSGPADEKPLLHTWSLAVEEQFYFFLPILLLVASRLPSSRWFKPIPIALGIVFVVSLAASVYGVMHHPSATFYLLPTRAWELVCGSLIAIVPATRAHQSRFARESAAVCGAAAILIPCFVFDRQTAFPGAAALPPCFGTALIIWSSSHSHNSAHSSMVSRALSIHALVAVGLISYSLYLWHWPLFCFERLLTVEVERSFSTAIGMTAAAFGVAWLSWRFVETPFRERRLCVSRPALFTAALSSGLCVLLAGLLVRYEQGFPARFSPKANAYIALAKNPAIPAWRPPTLDDVLHDRLQGIGDVESGSPPTVLIWGDSHALFAASAFDSLLRERRVSGTFATHAATPPVLDWYFIYRDGGLCEKSPQYNAALLDYAVRQRLRHVVLIANWRRYLLSPGSQPIAEQPAGDSLTKNSLEAGLYSLITRLRDAQITPWLMLPVPGHDVSVPRALAWQEMHGGNPNHVGRSATAEPSPYKLRFDLEKVRALGCRILDPIPEFLNAGTGRYDVVRDDEVLYCDDNHLTEAGARKVLLPFLRREFKFE